MAVMEYGWLWPILCAFVFCRCLWSWLADCHHLANNHHFGFTSCTVFYETVQTARGPLKLRGHIPTRGLAMSSFILLGVAFIQFEHAARISAAYAVLCIFPLCWLPLLIRSGIGK